VYNNRSSGPFSWNSGLWENGVRVSGYMHFPMRVDRLQVEKMVYIERGKGMV
jgi:hypothetical protein